MTIYIPLHIYQTMQGFVTNCDYEISWVSKVEKYLDGLIINDVRLVGQEVSSVGTRMNARAIGKEWDKIIKEEGSLKDWKGWCHSHATMETFWSQTDIAEILDHDNETSDNNWLLSLEFNHKMEWICRLDVFYPVHITHTIETMIVIRPNNNEINDFCRQEIKEKVLVQNENKQPKEKLDIEFDSIKKKINSLLDFY